MLLLWWYTWLVKFGPVAVKLSWVDLSQGMPPLQITPEECRKELSKQLISDSIYSLWLLTYVIQKALMKVAEMDDLRINDPKFALLVPWAGDPLVIGEFQAQMTAGMLNVSMTWRHQELWNHEMTASATVFHDGTTPVSFCKKKPDDATLVRLAL